MEEIWIPIKDYEGLYEVSSSMRVRSVERTVYHSRGNGYHMKLKGRLLVPQYTGKLKSLLCVKLFKEGVENRQLLQDIFHAHFDVEVKKTKTQMQKASAYSQPATYLKKENPLREALEDAECILEYFDKGLDEEFTKTGKEQPMQQQIKALLKTMKSLRYA